MFYDMYRYNGCRKKGNGKKSGKKKTRKNVTEIKKDLICTNFAIIIILNVPNNIFVIIISDNNCK